MKTALSRTQAGMLLALLTALLCVPSCDAPPEPGAPSSPALREAERSDVSPLVSAASAAGLYHVGLSPVDGVIPLNELHAWRIDVATVGGEPFRPTRMAFSGGMPQHQHGFITDPHITRALGPGAFLVEGVKFHMSGDWTLRVELVGPSGPDVAILHVEVGP